MVAELAALAALIVVAIAEGLHAGRVRRLGRLAFGPTGRPSAWALLAPPLRVAACGAIAWGMATLLVLPPRAREAGEIPDRERRHLVLVLDVSPSMKLEDAGPEGKQGRSRRVAELLGSFFKRFPVEQYLVSVVAVYNGAKPVVVDTKDLDVVRNVLDDLPLHYAFPVGKTDLFAGLEEAAKIAHPWPPRSAVMLMLTDGDTVPSTGMPELPASIGEVVVVGVGDARRGRFIDGGMSRQDVSTLRQVATRLRGTYHDGNQKHLPTDLLRRLAMAPEQNAIEKLTRREYALMAIGAGAAVLAGLPVLLHHYGTRWRPGVRATTAARDGRRAAVGVG